MGGLNNLLSNIAILGGSAMIVVGIFAKSKEKKK